MGILHAIHKSFATAVKKGWDKTYWCVDIHETIVIPNYKLGDIPREFYPLAKETLQKISRRKDIILILYTCSHPNEISEYLEFFKSNDIHFKYVNENPEVQNESYGCYDLKFYYNVLLDDKAGLVSDDWKIISDILDGYIIKEI